MPKQPQFLRDDQLHTLLHHAAPDVQSCVVGPSPLSALRAAVEAAHEVPEDKPLIMIVSDANGDTLTDEHVGNHFFTVALTQKKAIVVDLMSSAGAVAAVEGMVAKGLDVTRVLTTSQKGNSCGYVAVRAVCQLFELGMRFEQFAARAAL